LSAERQIKLEEGADYWEADLVESMPVAMQLVRREVSLADTLEFSLARHERDRICRDLEDCAVVG
jgi:hypothetical protein